MADDRRAAKPLPWNSETADSISSTAMNDSEYDPHPAIEIAWLVSGNEGWFPNWPLCRALPLLVTF